MSSLLSTLNALLWVGAGGALGSGARYLAMSAVAVWAGNAFPWGTLFVNIVGSFVMGVLAELGALAWQPSPQVKLLLLTGVLGGFTTFSTFSLDVAVLVERHDWMMAGLYIVASVTLSVLALFAALALIRNLV